MRVHVDDQIFSFQRSGGISRYFTELLNGFASEATNDVELVPKRIFSDNRHLLATRHGRQVPALYRFAPRSVRIRNRLSLLAARVDVVQHTYYDSRYLRQHKQGRLRVVTIYDMIPELFPGEFERGNPHLQKDQFVAAADVIICISETTRQDLLRIYGHLSKPVEVVLPGIGTPFRPGVPADDRLPKRYVLFVGRRDGYKDFAVAAEALSKGSVPSDVHFVAAGGGGFTDSEATLLQAMGLRGRALQMDFTDDALVAAYANALCFVFPSRYEGFGLPTLEAMASGCPVVLSRSPAHVEVGKDAAAFFAPQDSDDLAEVLAEVADDSALRRSLRDAGLRRAATFTWSSTAHHTLDVYRAGLRN